jgi:putative membrane protein
VNDVNIKWNCIIGRVTKSGKFVFQIQINLNQKNMFYYNYFWGMDLIWWVLWVIMLVWIFAVPYDIPFQRNRKRSALEVLQGRLAAGDIGIDEYHERKKIMEIDLIKKS